MFQRTAVINIKVTLILLRKYISFYSFFQSNNSWQPWQIMFCKHYWKSNRQCTQCLTGHIKKRTNISLNFSSISSSHTLLYFRCWHTPNVCRQKSIFIVWNCLCVLIINLLWYLMFLVLSLTKQFLQFLVKKYCYIIVQI